MGRFLIAILSILISHGVAVAEPIVTASHTLPSTSFGWFNVGAGIATDSGNEIGPRFDNRLAQTFTTTTGGRLSEACFFAKKQSYTNSDLRVSITSVAGGQPGAVLGTVLMNASSFPVEDYRGRPDNFNSIASFSLQDVYLDAGTQYAIVFSSDTTQANYRIYGDYSGYAAGTMMSYQNNGPFVVQSGDLIFQVTVFPVPEPGTTAMTVSAILVACVYIAMWYRREKKGVGSFI